MGTSPLSTFQAPNEAPKIEQVPGPDLKFRLPPGHGVQITQGEVGFSMQLIDKSGKPVGNPQEFSSVELMPSGLTMPRDLKKGESYKYSIAAPSDPNSSVILGIKATPLPETDNLDVVHRFEKIGVETKGNNLQRDSAIKGLNFGS